MDSFVISSLKSEGCFSISATLLLLAVAEAGFHCGKRMCATGGEARRSLSSGIQGAALGLLALLLGFTFALALNRFDERRLLVVKEANTIGTTWLRASLLPLAHRAPVRVLLRRYVDLRVDSFLKVDDPAEFAKVSKLNDEIQAELWQHVEAASSEAPNAVTVSFTSALNEMIDAGSERVAAARANIPAGVTLMLFVVAAFGCFVSNYAAGLYGTRFLLNGVALPLVVAVTMTLIYDFADPRQGMIRLNIQSLKDQQASMK